LEIGKAPVGKRPKHLVFDDGRERVVGRKAKRETQTQTYRQQTERTGDSKAKKTRSTKIHLTTEGKKQRDAKKE